MEHTSGPVLVAVDEDADVIRDVERELRDRYARHYRVVCMRSPREVLANLEADHFYCVKENAGIVPCASIRPQGVAPR